MEWINKCEMRGLETSLISVQHSSVENLYGGGWSAQQKVYEL